MKNNFAGKFAVLFWILAIADTVGAAVENQTIHFYIKPLLIPALAAWLYFSKKKSANKNLLLSGLFFSFAGDVLLLFESRYPTAFIFGLAAFLITHILYILFFLKHKPVEVSLLKKQPLTGMLVVAYGVSLVWLLFPGLGELKLPVVVYAAAICTMLLCSLHIFLKVNAPANIFYVLGALLFVLSDSILALNKFYEPIIAANALIMATYCAAQYFIVKGFVSEKEYMQ